MFQLTKRRRRALMILGAGLLVLILLACVPFTGVQALAWMSPQIVWYAQTSEPIAALTFDDGPHPEYTPQVLDILARHNVRATFFLVGEHARRHPELVARIRAQGHEIGNHTDSLRTTFYMSADAFEASLLRAERTLGLGAPPAARLVPAEASPQRPGLAPVEALPSPPERAPRKLLRPAGGTIRPAQLRRAQQHGYTCVLGSSYAWDPAAPPAAYIAWAITKNLRPGAIVVLHDAGGDRSNTVAALEAILADAREKKLRWVTVSELLQ